MSRITECTPEITEAACIVLRRGGYRNAAALSVGIDGTTFSHWMRQGKEGREPYCTFSLAIKKAEREAEVALVERIRSAAESDDKLWTAAAWLLERRNPARWGRHDRVNVDAKVQDVTNEDPAARLARLKSVVSALESARKVDDDEG